MNADMSSKTGDHIQSGLPPLVLYVMPHLPCRHNEMKLVTGRVLDGVSERGRTLSPLARMSPTNHGPIAAIITSRLPRALETVDLCFADCGTPVIQDDRLTAIDYGSYHERPILEIKPIRHQFITSPYPSGESYTDMADRYRDLLCDLYRQFIGVPLLLIGHDATISILNHVCDGLPLEQALELRDFEERSDAASLYGKWFGPFSFSPKRL